MRFGEEIESNKRDTPTYIKYPSTWMQLNIQAVKGNLKISWLLTPFKHKTCLLGVENEKNQKSKYVFWKRMKSLRKESVLMF